MFKLINGGEKLPTRATRFSAGFDVYSREDKVIGAGCTELIGLGIAIDLSEIEGHFIGVYIDERDIETEYLDEHALTEFKERHFLELHIRSSLRAKGLTSLGTGIIDMDFVYPNEIKMVVHNPICGYEDVEHYEHGTIAMPYGASMLKGELNQAYTINKGDKIGQLILKRHEGYLLPEEYTLNSERQGGFGSTGVK